MWHPAYSACEQCCDQSASMVTPDKNRPAATKLQFCCPSAAPLPVMASKKRPGAEDAVTEHVIACDTRVVEASASVGL